MIVGLNGVRMEEDQAVISVFDHGFLYGMGLFETFRSYKGVPFLLTKHMERLAEGCEQLGIRYEPDIQVVRHHLNELLAANGLSDGYIRMSVSAGVQPLGLPASDYEQPTVIVYVKPLPPALLPRGKSLQLLKLRRNTPEGSLRLKSFHYMNNILARRELSLYPWAVQAEGLFLEENGFVAEGIVSNLFFAKGHRLLTPSLDTGILPGITREHVLHLAEAAGIATEQGRYPLDQLLEADEIFMTNSVQEIIPIHTLFNQVGEPVWITKEKKLTSLIQSVYTQSIEDYIRRC